MKEEKKRATAPEGQPPTPPSGMEEFGRHMFPGALSSMLSRAQFTDKGFFWGRGRL